MRSIYILLNNRVGLILNQSKEEGFTVNMPGMLPRLSDELPKTINAHLDLGQVPI